MPVNYIQHTRAARQRLAEQPAARPHHIALYWELFFQWNTARFPVSIDLDHEAIRQAAHIGSKHTYRATLYELQGFGLLTYLPSQSRHHPSRCKLTPLSGPEVAPVNPPTEARSDPDKTPLPGPEVAQALRPEAAPITSLPGPEVAQDTLLGKTEASNSSGVNGSAATPQKKIGEVFAGEGLSAAQVLDDGQPAAAPKRKVAPKQKGVGQGPQAQTIRAAAARPPSAGRRRAPLPELSFRESTLYDFAAFTAALADTDYALADLRHYHQLIDNWRDKETGLPPLRRDWVACAKKFMLNDAADNRLKLAPNVQPHQPGTGPGPTHTGARATGYRSKRWN